MNGVNHTLDSRKVERTMKAFANRRRIEIVRLLKRRKDVGVGAIAEAIKLSLKSTSRHLSVLYSADVVGREQRGLEVYYYLSREMPPSARHIVTIL